MKTAARLKAAMEVLETIGGARRPASLALKDWGRSHRFAGSGDRAAIGTIVFDALRQRRLLAWAMGADNPRALVLGVAALVWHLAVDKIDALCDGHRFAPAPLTDTERSALQNTDIADAPEPVKGNYPDWLADEFSRAFGADAAEEGADLSRRAPLDLRVNTLKTSREKLARALQRLEVKPTQFAATGLRIAPPVGAGRLPHIESHGAHGKGWFEVQDEGSQLAAALTGAAPGMQVADICAGAGGKTLALAALMGNRGQIHAWDVDPRRLRPIWERLKRAGARNVQVLEGGDSNALEPLQNRMDLVVVDAPCSGSGTWRRKPDAKWRLTEAALEKRLDDQSTALAMAAPLVRRGGTLAYITCSVLPRENADQADRFLRDYPGFKPASLPPLLSGLPENTSRCQLTPRRHGTDGFFIALFQRND
jgi:16S rRNA (cytosine967-C5)-methyltransferase